MAGGDGRLTHDLVPGEKGPAGRLRRLRCLGPRRRGRQAHLLRALRAAAPRPGVGRHRGQQRLADPGLQGHGPGLPGLRRAHASSSLKGHLAVGHCRYSTTGASTWDNAQPTFRRRDRGTVALAHNGNLTNTAELRDLARRPQRRGLRRHLGGELRRGNTTDTALVTALLADDPDRSLEAAALDVLPAAPGRLLLRLHGRAHAVRRPRPAGHPPAGPRPPRARLGRGQRDRGPGHRRRQPRSARSSRASWSPSTRTACAPSGSPRPTPKGCVFEYVYLARPDTTIAGRGVHEAPGRDGPPAGRASTRRGRPGHPDARVGHPGRDRLRARSPASPTARGWSRTPTSAARSSSPARPSASSASGSSSTRSRTSSGQAAGRRRRLDRARQHPARPGPDAARGRRRARCTCASPARR